MNHRAVIGWLVLGVGTLAWFVIERALPDGPGHIAARSSAGFQPAPPRPAKAPARPPPTESAAERWHRLIAAPAAIARDAELVETLGELIEADADAAAGLLEPLTESERLRLGTVVLWDAARDPDRAARHALVLCQVDPNGATAYGYALIGVLSRQREFLVAVEFLADADQSLTSSEDPGKWTRRLFAEWAAVDPSAAAAAALALPTDGLRGEALVGAARDGML